MAYKTIPLGKIFKAEVNLRLYVRENTSDVGKDDQLYVDLKCISLGDNLDGRLAKLLPRGYANATV